MSSPSTSKEASLKLGVVCSSSLLIRTTPWGRRVLLTLLVSLGTMQRRQAEWLQNQSRLCRGYTSPCQIHSRKADGKYFRFESLIWFLWHSPITTLSKPFLACKAIQNRPQVRCALRVTLCQSVAYLQDMHYLLWAALCCPGSHSPKHLCDHSASVPISVPSPDC